MLPVMEQNPAPKTENVRLNVAVKPKLHKDLRTLSVQLGEPLTQLVPRLLQLGLEVEKQRQSA